MTVGIGLGCFMRTVVGGELEKLLIAEFAEVWCTGHPISASEIGAYRSGGRLAGKIPHDLAGKDEQCPVKMPCYDGFLEKEGYSEWLIVGKRLLYLLMVIRCLF